MALREDIVEERIALDRIVKRSMLGKHINENILRPILDSIDNSIDRILNDLGFMIVSEIQYRLHTAPIGNVYQVYEVNEEAERGSRYSFIGYYHASAAGGPPHSPGEPQEAGLPTGSLYESIWYAVDRSGVVSVTIESPQETERNYWFKAGKVFLGFKKHDEALPVAEYFKILNRKTRPDWWGITINRKRKYWYNWMETQFAKAVKESTRRWSVHRALKFNIYWESHTS
jgi:hypothetical protein